MVKDTVMNCEKVIQKKTWGEFYHTFAIDLANLVLRPFGWVIVVEEKIDENYHEVITDAFPASIAHHGHGEAIAEKLYQCWLHYKDK